MPESAHRPLRIAHISDLHVLDLKGVSWRRFLNKRMSGAVNLAGMRRNAHPVHVAEQLADRLAQDDIDHVIVTGDVTNLALDAEFRRAREVIERIGPPSRVTLIPGNHDMYTRGALKHRRFEHWFAEYLVDDDSHQIPRDKGRLHYPFVRNIAPHVRLYGLSSAVPTLPFLAYGHVGKPQFQRLLELVKEEPPEVKVRIVLVHHNLHQRLGAAEYVASLVDRKAFSAAMRSIKASAVLHGHTHHPHQGHLPERLEAKLDSQLDQQIEASLQETVGAIPVIGCGSSTWHRAGREFARFNVIEVGARAIDAVHSMRFTGPETGFVEEHKDLLHKSLLPQGAIRL